MMNDKFISVLVAWMLASIKRVLARVYKQASLRLYAEIWQLSDYPVPAGRLVLKVMALAGANKLAVVTIA